MSFCRGLPSSPASSSQPPLRSILEEQFKTLMMGSSSSSSSRVNSSHNNPPHLARSDLDESRALLNTPVEQPSPALQSSQSLLPSPASASPSAAAAASSAAAAQQFVLNGTLLRKFPRAKLLKGLVREGLPEPVLRFCRWVFDEWWHVACDVWHMTCDMWRVKCDL